MAKKKKGEREMSEQLLSAFQGKNKEQENISMNSLEEMADMAFGSLSENEKDDFQAMLALALRGITPEEYTQFYHIFNISGKIAEKIGADPGMDEFPFMSGAFGKKRIEIKEYEPLKDASEHTLVLKIQMKDVTKPPMWREVEVPADFDFMQLHEVIQEVVGLENYHMWQFNAKAYDNSLQISADMENDSPFGGGMDGMTHDAEETYLTQFLQHKGDKLEYVYDFGDDWIFTVEVKELCDKKIDHPVCRKYKSELNALEDFGGIWSYLDARQDLDTWEKMSKKERKKRFQERGFDSEEEYLEFLNEHRFNLDEVNAALEAY